MLACDGIWDVLSNEDVCIFVREQIAQGLYPEEICENLMTKCLAPDCQVSDIAPVLSAVNQFDSHEYFCRWVDLVVTI